MLAGPGCILLLVEPGVDFGGGKRNHSGAKSADDFYAQSDNVSKLCAFQVYSSLSGTESTPNQTTLTTPGLFKPDNKFPGDRINTESDNAGEIKHFSKQNLNF